MKISTILIIAAVLLLAMHCGTSAAADVDRGLATPPEVSAEWMTLASAELEPGVVEKTHMALASDQVGYTVNSELYVQTIFMYRVNTDKESPRATFAQQLNLEKVIPETADVSAWATLYHDQEFRAAYAGLAKRFGNWQVALGVGHAWYDDTNHAVINPWVYYSDSSTELFLTAEHYSNTEKAPWFYKGQLTHRISETFFAGIYGEKDMGLGPMFGVAFAKRFKGWMAIPIAYRPDEEADRTKMLLGLSIEF